MLFQTNSIIGHRGCKLVDQNNTLEAFEKAIDLGVEMVEMDIRKTRDDVLVVFHDSTVGGLRIRGALYDEVVESANEVGLVVPTLETILNALAGRVQVCVELKESGYEDKVMSMLLQYFLPNEFIVISFLDSVVKKIKNGFPTVQTGLLLGTNSLNKEFAWHGARRAYQIISEFFPWYRVRMCGADFIAVNWRLLKLGLLHTAYKRKVPVLLWTINDEVMMKKFLSTRKVNYLITDRPDLAVPIRNNLS